MDITGDKDFGDETAHEEEDLLISEDEYQTGENEIIARRSSQSFNNIRSQHIKKLTEKVKIEDVVKDNVLSFLPAKSLSRFKSVSKDWNEYISNRPLLAHEQSYRFRDLSGFFVHRADNAFLPYLITLNRACYGVPRPELGFLPHPSNDVTVVSSCRGLLLCHVTAGYTSYYCICNPVTRQWRDVPEPEYYHGPEPKIVLAFEPSMLNIEAHYQIVCALPPIDQPAISFEIYSSQTRSWRESSAACTELGGSVITGDGYYIDGVCYWKTDTRRVLAYDPKNDLYGLVNLPRGGPRDGTLARIRGELSYVCAGEEQHHECYISIYGGLVEMGLRQRIGLTVGPVYGEVRGCRVLCCVDDDAMFVLIGRVIYCYKLRDQSVEVVCEDVDGGAMERVRYLPYVNSLVPVA